jgi:opacity protein-like surface antigen
MKPKMQRVRVAGFFGVALAASTIAGRAQGYPTGYPTPTGLYITGGLGPALTEDADLKEFFGPVSGSEARFDTGVRFSFGIGYQFNEWLGAEFDTGVIFNSVKSVTGSPDADFDVVHAPFLANVVFQCPRTAPLIPFFGVGAGFEAAEIDIDRFTLGGLTVTGRETDVVYAYQGFAGVRYEFNDQFAAGLTYKYFGAGEPEWESDFGPNGKIRFGRTASHTVLVTFTYKF